MPFLNKVQKATSENLYETKIKPKLLKKDGFTHIVMINSFSKFLNQSFDCDDKYTTQIDEILTSMQKDGYEIVDVKFNSIQNQGLFKELEGFHTLVTYK